MKKYLASILFGFVLINISMTAFASCKSDLKKVANYSKEATGAKNLGDFSRAQKYYQRAARKLGGMKYTCREISLKELTKKETHYRALAANVGKPGSSTKAVAKSNSKTKTKTKFRSGKKSARTCGKSLPRASKLIAEGRRARYRKRKANYAAAREMLRVLKKRCPGTKAAAVANKLLASMSVKSAKPTRVLVIKTSKQPAVKKSKRQKDVNSRKPVKTRKVASKRGSRKDKRFGRFPGKRSCILKQLLHVYTVEQQGYRALKAKNFILAADRFVQAADAYESNSQKCTSNKDKLAVIDRAGRIRVIVANITKKHIHCDQRMVAVGAMTKVAYKDEDAGEYDLAQEGYAKAVKAYENMPQVCGGVEHSKRLNENRAKRTLLGCAHYIDGVKHYNKAFKAISKARKKIAAAAYGKAAVSFDLALGNCNYNAANTKILIKLKVYSLRSKARLTKK